jgi:hypothetical protein
MNITSLNTRGIAAKHSHNGLRCPARCPTVAGRRMQLPEQIAVTSELAPRSQPFRHPWGVSIQPSGRTSLPVNARKTAGIRIPHVSVRSCSDPRFARSKRKREGIN